jgi:uridine kinase
MSVLARVVGVVQGLAAVRSRVLVAIDGPDCAGKTTFADALASAVSMPVLRASIDSFHNPREVRTARGLLSPEGFYRDSFDYSALERQLLTPFAAGSGEVRTTVYDHRRDVAVDAGPVSVGRDALLVLDGVFLLRPELRAWWTTSVYLHVSPETTLMRALVRDLDELGSAEEVRLRYEQRYLPGQALYRAEASPLDAAAVVVDNTDPAAPVVVHWRLN